MNKSHIQIMHLDAVGMLIRNLMILSLLLSWQVVYAGDTSLFQYNKSDTALDLSSSEIMSPAAVSADMVQVEVKILIEEKNFTIVLPDGRTYNAVATSVEKRGDNSWSWSGTLSSEDGVNGTAILTVVNGVTAGLITLPHVTYELSPFNATESLLQEIDSSLYPPEHPHEDEMDPNEHENDGSFEAHDVDDSQQFDIPEMASPPDHRSAFDTDFSVAKLAKTNFVPTLNTNILSSLTSITAGNPQIDVLVVYTSTARSAAGGTANIKTMIQNAVDITNTAYNNSNVPQRIKLVHSAEVNYTEVNSLSNALNWVQNDATVANLRDNHGADLVAMITEQGGGYCGLAKVMRTVNASFESKAFSTTKRTCAVGNLSFTHELGHNEGLEHDPANGTSPANASYTYAFGHFANGNFRTVMSYSNQCTSGCTRIPYFSNPSVSTMGLPTGVTNQRDNARVLRNTDNVIAAFRQGLPAKSVLISPAGDIADTTPTYRWNAVPTASWYQLFVNDSTGNVINEVISASDVGCNAGTGTCSVTMATMLAEGNGNWRVNSWNGNWGSWSNAKSFKVIGVPARPTLLSPANIFTLDSTPTYKWNAVSTATWYRLWVNDSTGNKINKWYTASQLGCALGSGTCTFTPPTALATGQVTWWVQAWNGKYSPWSSNKQFTVFTFTIPLLQPKFKLP